MTEKLTKNQIDKLGDRLRDGAFTDNDLVMLREYTASFDGAYGEVVGMIRDRLRLEPSGRNPKTERSIIDKLRRGKMRLSRMQDIAGCRVIVENVIEQDRTVDLMKRIFPNPSVVDRRAKPSHGYRAVHVIVEVGERWVEIQARTQLQHLWAEYSQQLADAADPKIRYGGGSPQVKEFLEWASNMVMEFEAAEIKHVALRETPESERIEIGRRIAHDRMELQKRLDEAADQLKQVSPEPGDKL